MTTEPPLVPTTDAEEAPQPTVSWRGRDLVWAAILGLVLGVAVMIPVAAFLAREGGDPPFALFGMIGLVIYACLFLTTWWIAIKRKGATLRDAGFRPVPLITLVKMVPVTIGMMILTAVLVSISSLLFGEVPTAQDQVVGDATSLTFGDFLWIMAVAAVAAPIAEEFLFRGMLFKLLRTKMKLVAAVTVSAIAFALLHFIPALIPALLGMGVVLALVADRYDSLYPAMLVHALNNGIAVIAIYAALG